MFQSNFFCGIIHLPPAIGERLNGFVAESVPEIHGESFSFDGKIDDIDSMLAASADRVFRVQIPGTGDGVFSAVGYRDIQFQGAFAVQ